jgi:hypothetical protein
MSMSDTTNLNDLPSTTGNHIAMEMSSMPPQSSSTQPVSLDQATISQIVNGLQHASLTGATRLPSRDIPMTSTHLTNDAEIMPNYVPKDEKYIIDDDDYVEPHKKSLFDGLYNNIQFPLLLAILFFIFQLPVFKNMMSKYLSFLFLSDGNYNMNGLTFLSVVFAMTYYVLTSVIFTNM